MSVAPLRTVAGMLESAYNGPAVLVDHEGNEHKVLAALRSTTKPHRFGEQIIEGLTSWSGTLSGPVSLDEILAATEPVTLRLPNGREGSVILVGVTADRALATGTGTGPPRFDTRATTPETRDLPSPGPMA